MNFNNYKHTSRFQQNVIQIKQYGNMYKIQYFQIVRQRGLEESYTTGKSDHQPEINYEKLPNNISRAKHRIIELASCNVWDYFITLTINPQKYNREDLQKFRYEYTRFLRKVCTQYGSKVRYLLIPEKHDKGGWHMHGLLYGLPDELLHKFELEEKLPQYIRAKLMNEETLYDFPLYHQKFGYVVIEPIKNPQATALYISKYVTKDLARTVNTLNSHLFFASHGLKGATEIARGSLKKGITTDSIDWDFENEYGYKVKTVSSTHIQPYLTLIEPLQEENGCNFIENYDRVTGEIFTTPFG